MRIGFGYDIHTLREGRTLILGGVQIPSDMGEEGYSDGDVLIHAIIDALLGAANKGDIGEHFPPGNPNYRDIESSILLKNTLLLIGDFKIVNIDTTIILQKPKIGRFKEKIANKLSQIMGINPEQISVKAKTKEGVDATGKGKAIEAYAVVLLENKNGN